MCSTKFSLLIIILCEFIVFTVSTQPRESKIYRSDYEYNAKTDAFYKFHIINLNVENAKRRCEVEGAVLMSPASKQDIIQAHGMLKRYPDLGRYLWLNEDRDTNSAEEKSMLRNTDKENDDVEDRYERGYDSDYELSGTERPPPDCEVMSREGDIDLIPCGQTRPFVCKVEANNAKYDSVCDVYGLGYEYVESVGSCYKIPRWIYAWNEAYAECQAEGAHLVVLNSEAEHVAVRNIMQKTHHLTNAYSPYYYIAGYRARYPSRTFLTVFNQTLEEAGYSQWADTEPNNSGGNEYCGSLYESDGKLNDHNCKNSYGFICEKEKHIIQFR